VLYIEKLEGQIEELIARVEEMENFYDWDQ
jgi:hypothetical protein